MDGSWVSVGIMTTVIGMAVVFLILIILWLFVALLDKAIDKKEKAAAGAGKNELRAAAPAAAPRQSATVAPGVDPKIVAAIMAAITAANAGRELRFVSIKRVNPVTGPWAASGRADQIAVRQSYL